MSIPLLHVYTEYNLGISCVNSVLELNNLFYVILRGEIELVGKNDENEKKILV